SLDRSVAALNVGVPQPLGEEGDCLHNWLFGDGTTAPKLIARSSKKCLRRPDRLSWAGKLSTPWKDHVAMTAFRACHASSCLIAPEQRSSMALPHSPSLLPDWPSVLRKPRLPPVKSTSTLSAEPKLRSTVRRRESSTRLVSIGLLYCCRQARGCSITSDPSG